MCKEPGHVIRLLGDTYRVDKDRCPYCTGKGIFETGGDVALHLASLVKDDQ